MAKTKTSENVPKQMQEVYEELSKLTDQFCNQNLNKEYAKICRKVAAALCRKRPSPLVSGRLNTWACGILHAVGTVNYAFDKSQKPSTTVPKIREFFEVAESTCAAKGKKVRELLKMNSANIEWLLQSNIDDNPRIWWIMVNGYIVDVRSMPVEVQEMAFEKGLIPYIPAYKEK